MVQAEVSAAREFDLPAEDCRAQLERILNSADFEATARERRFLSHVVEETLAGRGSRIKAYSIAVEVFGRDASFDPQTDPIVRVEAGHLRRSLERYYFTAGQADPILITIPKGGYVPAFALRPQPVVAAAHLAAPPAVAAAPVWWRQSVWLRVTMAAVTVLVAAGAALAWWWTPRGTGTGMPEAPRLLVETFEDLTGTDNSSALAKGLTQEVIGQLAKFKDIIVVQSEAGQRAGTGASSPRFVLAGSVDLSEDAFRLRVRFLGADGSVLWADSYDGEMKVAKLLRAQDEIARNVATTLAQTYGVIHQAEADSPPDDWAAYSCTLAYYAYRVDLDSKARGEVRTCLERAVERFPNYATAWALLAQISIDELRFQFPFDPGSSQAEIDRILAMARRAADLDPRNVRALHAEMSALFWNREFEAGRKVGEQAMAINPNDTDLMGGFGTRLALSGSWDQGCALVPANDIPARSDITNQSLRSAPTSVPTMRKRRCGSKRRLFRRTSFII